MRKIAMQKSSVLLYTALFLGGLPTSALASHVTTISGLRSISIYASPDVQENNNAAFYANNIELEPVKITLCYANGYKPKATTRQLSYFYSLGSGGAGAVTSMPTLNSNRTDSSGIYLYDKHSEYYKYYNASGMITTGGLFHSTQKFFVKSYVHTVKNIKHQATVICNGGYPGQTLYVYLRASKINPFNVQIMAKNEKGTMIRSSPDDVNFSTKKQRTYAIRDFVFNGYEERNSLPFMLSGPKRIYNDRMAQEYVFLPNHENTAQMIPDTSVTIKHSNLDNSGLEDNNHRRHGLELYKIVMPRKHRKLASPLFYRQLSLSSASQFAQHNAKRYLLFYNKISLRNTNPPIEVAYGDRFPSYGIPYGAKKVCHVESAVHDQKNRFAPHGMISYMFPAPHKNGVYYSVKGNAGYYQKNGNTAPIHEQAFSLVIAYSHTRLAGNSRSCKYGPGMGLEGFDQYGNHFNIRYTPKMGSSKGGSP